MAKDKAKDAKDAKLTPEQEKKLADKKAKRAASKKALKDARGTMHTYMQTADFAKLPKEVQDAITRLAAKATREGGTRKNWLDMFTEIFPKVGAKIHELDLFKSTKMGRGEFRKKVRHALKKADPAKRMWIAFDEKAESWSLLSIGENPPEGFK